MIQKVFLFSAITLSAINANSQCDTTYISGSYTQNSDVIMGGVYYIDGNFTLPSGITIYVSEYGFGGCGSLEIHADNITIAGTINGDYAGYEGGAGGSGGILISSLTGHLNALTDCQNKDDAGRVEVEGGLNGISGDGAGSGNAGSDGGQGSGPKQQCLTGDESGMIGGSGGAGGGSGGSYGGTGTVGGNGGSGTDNYIAVGLNVSAAYAVVGGSGGTGGSVAAVYGTATGFDIDLGSGGAGAGGGGRSFDTGLNGGTGGNGGGMVKLVASGSFTLSGTISVNGGDGLSGGNGGSGGVTPKCCSDGCDDCGEATISAGAGGGGGAGGGSGGGIFIESGGTISLTGNVYAQGGNGGAGGSKGYGTGCTYNAGLFCGDDQSITSEDGEDGGQGGAGGGGRIKIFYVTCANAVINPAGVSVASGNGNGTANEGTYETICGYVGAEELPEIDAQIFPVPATDILNYNLPAAEYIERLFIYNGAGQIVLDMTDVPRQDMLDISYLEEGFYVISFMTGSQVISKTFVKE